ncbi:MAG: uroporphyrinogen-III C-methyltransferase [Proteobacteria bacterium]|nr:uroporphyrinogen-III C-methyltransferase [Pseudomonadota bacterium]
MNDKTDKKPDTTADDNSANATESPVIEKAKPANNGTSASGGLALVLSLAALIGTGYLAWLLLVQNPGLVEGDINATTEALIEDTSKLQEQFGNHEKQLSELSDNQEVIKEAIERAFTKLGRDRRGWALTETEQLLIIANHRLQLARDIPSAIATLETADRQLRSLADPRLLPVRKAIAKEITVLKELEPIDRAGMVLKLEALMSKTDELPLSVKTRAKSLKDDGGSETKAGEEQSVWSELWSDVRNLIRIRDNVEQQLPLLPPEQSWFLRENLRLVISGARHALLAGDKVSYEHSLNTAGKWIRTYFDANTKITAAMLADISALSKTDIAISLPDISESLKTLRQLKEQRNQS